MQRISAISLFGCSTTPRFGSDWATALGCTPDSTTGEASAVTLSGSIAMSSRIVRCNTPLLDLAVCPNCRAAIARDTEPWCCSACAARFPVSEGSVRVLVLDRDDYKRAQAVFFDEGVD